MFNAKIEIYDGNQLHALYKSLKPDVDEKDEIELLSDHISIAITTHKFSDLRARINSYLKLCKAVIDCIV